MLHHEALKRKIVEVESRLSEFEGQQATDVEQPDDGDRAQAQKLQREEELEAEREEAGTRAAAANERRAGLRKRRRSPGSEMEEADSIDGGEGSCCTICMEPLHGAATCTTSCGHSFHHQCMLSWLGEARAPACPLCKRHVSARRLALSV